MIKTKSLVFSLVRDQSVFMTALLSLLTFLSVLALGVALSVGTGVIKWNAQWDLFATVQILSENNAAAAQKVINDNRDKIAASTEISKPEMQRLLKPWISGGNALGDYLPKMFEIKFKNKSDIKPFGEQISPHARFLTHRDALQSSAGAGWRMIFISVLVLALVLASIGVCISYIARNTAMLHRRELEILNQIGAHDDFVARQMQVIVAKICIIAGAIGFVAAVPVLLLILGAAHSARVGLMAMMGLGTFGWIILALAPAMIVIFSIYITKRTTLSLLQK